MIDLSLVYDEMNKILFAHKSIERVMILKTTNGGGTPKVGSPIYAFALYQVAKPPLKITKESYQKLLVDNSYIKILIESETKEAVKLEVSKMEDCLLKQIYEVEKVTYSEIYFLRDSKKSFYYMSIATHENKARFTDNKTRLSINLAVNNIRNCFKGIN